MDKHFEKKENVLNKVFNQNKIKISYSCVPNIGQIIKSHNTKLLNNDRKVKENHALTIEKKIVLWKGNAVVKMLFSLLA